MRYIVSISDKPSHIGLRFFQPRTITTNVTAPGQAIVTALYTNDMNHLAQEVDAYLWSATYVSKCHRDFLAKYGLLDKTNEQIDEYMDDNALYFPEPNRIDIGRIGKRDKIRIIGMGKYGAVLTGYGED